MYLWISQIFALKKFLQLIYKDNPVPMMHFYMLMGVVIIGIIGWIFTQEIYNNVDLLFWDEANYLSSGKMMFHKFNKSWGPTYALWYKFLSYIDKDSIPLYYLNYRLMAILPAIALFIFLLQSNIKYWVSLGISLLFIFADINFPVWPKVSHYSIFVLITGLIIMRMIKTPSLKVSFIAYVVLFLAYARPEVFLTYVAIIVIWIIILCTDTASRRPLPLAISILAIIGTLMIQWKIGNPMFLFHGNRSTIAFAQHFMLNYYQWKGIHQDFWITWMPYYAKEFGTSQTILEAYHQNAALLIKHFTSNFQLYISEAYRLFSDVMLPEKLVQIPVKTRILIITLGGFISISLLGKRRYIHALILNLNNNLLVIIILLFFIAPSIIASMVIYPRAHYLLLQLPFVLLIATLFFFSNESNFKKPTKLHWLFGIVIGLMCYCKMPALDKYDFFDLWRKENSLANLNTINKLRSYNFNIPVRLLENEGGVNLFLSDNYTWIRGFTNTKPFMKFIKDEQIQVIYVTPSLSEHYTMVQDSTWLLFSSSPEVFGFKKIITGNHKPYLLIESELLKTATK